MDLESGLAGTRHNEAERRIDESKDDSRGSGTAPPTQSGHAFCSSVASDNEATCGAGGGFDRARSNKVKDAQGLHFVSISDHSQGKQETW